MNTALAQRTCVPCQTGASDLGPSDIVKLHQEVPEWNLVEEEDVKKLKREFTFSNWNSAWEAAEKISNLAKEQDHHPVLTVDWGKVTVIWWTHKVGGLHSNDFVMAAKTSEILG